MGHLHVVHGNLTALAADAVLIPTDTVGEVLPHWAPFHRTVDRVALRTELSGSRVSGPHLEDGRRVRFVDTGATPTTATLNWLAEGVRAGVRAAVGDVLGTEPLNRRGRPLVAMPVFGVGAGGFDEQRGAALDTQLREVRRAIEGADVDAVVVCWDRSDYAAVQSRRESRHWTLSDALREQAELLAAAVRGGRLALFLGAGVSVAAGIGDFARLVGDLEVEASGSRGEGTSSAELARRIDQLQQDRGKDWVHEQVRRAVDLPRHALLHGLLASLRVEESVTTNFDRLYELAATRPFAETPLQVLPWSRTSTRSPWLLKAHGDPAHPQPLVLDTPSFAEFEQDRPSVAALVRSLFTLSREVLFVGYSLTDPNITRLVDSAAELHRTYAVEHARLGTIVDLDAVDEDTTANPVKLGLRAPADESFTAATLRLQEFVDHLGWLVAKGEDSWLIDDRYGSLLGDTDREFAKQVAGLPVPAGPVWQTLANALTRWGRRAG